MSPGCPDSRAWEELLEDRLEANRAAALEAHLASCPACRCRLDAISGADRMHCRALNTPPPDQALPPGLLERVRTLEAPAEDEVEDLVRAWLDPHPDPSLLGTLAELEVVEVLARGGMGIVLKAREPALQRLVAVKVLAPELAVSTSARTRFLREGRAGAAIDHPNVLPLFRVDEENHLPFLVMPFVDGENLQQRLDREGALAPDEAVRIATAVASGLQAAHTQGLVHRDVKPANILLDARDERVWVTDFGLARAAEEASLTQSGTLVGTPEFMSPEQAEGGEVDARSDLFSLGALLYAMLSGRSPFASDGLVAAARKVTDHRPGPPPGPPWLAVLVGRLLRKDPAGRPRNMREVLEVLQARKIPRPRRRAGIAALAGLGILAAFAGAIPLFRSDEKLAVRAGGQRYPDLRTAVRQAPPGAVIELSGRGDFAWQKLDLPAKALTLRAAEGARPVFTWSRPEPALRSRAPLVLEGLWFRHTGTGPMSHFLEADDRLVLENCRFTKPWESGRLLDQSVIRFSGSELVLENCVLVSVRSALVHCTRAPHAVALTNNLLMASTMLSMGAEATDTTRVSGARNAFVGRHLMSVASPDHRPAFELRACYFDLPKSILSLPDMEPGTLNRRVDWTGSGNAFERQTVYFERVSGNRRHRLGTLSGWRKVWGERVSGPREISTGIRARVTPHRRRPGVIDLEALGVRGEFERIRPPAGPDFERLGPGAAYDRRRAGR